jgi:hypothetical protein
MRTWLIFGIFVCAGILTACDSNTNDTDIPTRVVIATLPPDATMPPLMDDTPTAEIAVAQSAPTDTNTTPISSDSSTATPSPIPTDGPSVTPSSTITDTPTRTASATLTETIEPQAVSLLAELALQVTIVLPTDLPLMTATPGVAFTLPAGCPVSPAGIFAGVVRDNPTLTNFIGCPAGEPPTTTGYSSALQVFERGTMIWLNTQPATIYVLYSDGRLARFADTFNEAIDPASSGLSAPEGLLEPIRGFGKVWRENAEVRDGLGWATASETPYTVTVHEFTLGRMIHISSRGIIYIFMPQSNRWQSVPA